MTPHIISSTPTGLHRCYTAFDGCVGRSEHEKNFSIQRVSPDCLLPCSWHCVCRRGSIDHLAKSFSFDYRPTASPDNFARSQAD
jgi:hypothetical protein